MNKPAQNDDRPFPKLMSVADVAEVLGVGTHTVRRLCEPDKETGAVQLPSIKVGSQTKIAKHDLWVYLRQARQTSANRIARRERSNDLVIPSVPVQEGDEVSIGGDELES